MRTKTTAKILSETSEETKQKVRDIANKLVMKQETLEEAIKRLYGEFYETTNREQRIMRTCKLESFRAGFNWQQERSYSDMQEYAIFCIECDRKELPLLLVEDWYKHYKK